MKKILITGAGTGLGQAMALRFAVDTVEMWLIGRRKEMLEETKSRVMDLNKNNKVHVHALDVTDANKVEDFFKQAPAFDVSVNNAAVEGARAEVQNLSLEQFDEVFDVDIRALFHFVSLEVKALRAEKKEGSIINISSVAGVVGIPSSSLYCAAKAAVIGLTKSVAAEQARHGIRVNAICPAGVGTPMLERIFNGDYSKLGEWYPIGRIGKPEEIAEAAAWLSHENSKFVIGHSLILDGGASIV